MAGQLAERRCDRRLLEQMHKIDKKNFCCVVKVLLTNLFFECR